ncbi:hypothetical protein FACS1894113_5040 [Alphaproteobacteria bacterium]|nr:hypothetical protein FACS1894113_5040 [Alphaproteobacteria bacterium]
MFIKILMSAIILSAVHFGFAAVGFTQDKIILRLGSNPLNQNYLTNGPDNSYKQAVNGEYKEKLERLGLKLENVWHNYWIEANGYMLCEANPDSEFKFAKHNAYITLIADFNAPHFSTCIRKKLDEVSAPGLDLIVTDDRTTKFIKRNSYSNLINLLKTGGKLVLTDIDENYLSQYYDENKEYMEEPKAIAEQMANSNFEKAIINIFKEYKVSYEDLKTEKLEYSQLSEEGKNALLKEKKLAIEKAESEARTLVDKLFNPENSTTNPRNMIFDGMNISVKFSIAPLKGLLPDMAARYLYNIGNPYLKNSRAIIITRI